MFPSRWRETASRSFDFGLALIGGFLTLPLMLGVAAAILLCLGRPVFFVQTRVGQGGKLFQMIKFRSMPATKGQDGNLLSDEERMTNFGRFLRRTRLDELPEFWNVLTGHMSIVGPRPLLPETILSMAANGVLRCSVKPGLTGWAQISGGVKLANDDKLDLDLWYIENRSFLLDIEILLQTPFFLIFGDRCNDKRLNAARQRHRRLAEFDDAHTHRPPQ